MMSSNPPPGGFAPKSTLAYASFNPMGSPAPQAPNHQQQSKLLGALNGQLGGGGAGQGAGGHSAATSAMLASLNQPKAQDGNGNGNGQADPWAAASVSTSHLVSLLAHSSAGVQPGGLVRSPPFC